MISLAANGFKDLYDLLAEGDLPIDYIKCPLSPNSREEVALALNFRPVVLHCWGPPGYSATRPEIPEPELLQELAEKTGTPFLSVHLDFQPELDGELERSQVIDRVQIMVQRLRDLTNLDVLLENVPWYPWMSRPRWGTDPSFIDECVKSIGASFLLDLAHAQVAAWHRNEPVEEYLLALPLEDVREIHVSGARMSDQGLRDRHMGLRESDFQLLEIVLDNAPATDLITHEYAGRRDENEPDGPETLAADLAKLHEIRLRRS